MPRISFPRVMAMGVVGALASLAFAQSKPAAAPAPQPNPQAASKPNAQSASKPASQPARPIVDELKEEALRLTPLFRSELVRDFLAEVPQLPPAPSRTIYRKRDKERFDRKTYYTAAEYAQLGDEAKKEVDPLPLSEGFYYVTRYGSPLAYSRALEILAENGLTSIRGKRIMDFGYGTAGHLRLLAGMGADVVGMDADPLLRVLYSEPGDQGAIKGRGATGNLKLVTGHWPADAAAKEGVGGDFDLIISKNTLKNGYINPEPGTDPRLTIELGVENEAYVKAVFAALKPGGLFLIYNICPAPAKPKEQPKPWADGRCPFAESMLKNAGFEVLAFDKDDKAAASSMAHEMEWDAGPQPMDLVDDFFVHYTLVRKPAR